MSRRLLWEDEVIKVVDKHTDDNNTLDKDISCILEEVDSGWIKCVPGQMPEDDKRYKGRKVINVLVTTANGEVTKVIIQINGTGVGYMVRIKRGCHYLNHIRRIK